MADKPAQKFLTLQDLDPDGSQDIKPAETSVARRVGDVGLGLARGAVSVPEAAVGLADIATKGRAGKMLENEGGAFGFRPKQAKEALSEANSPALKDAQWRFENADGVLGKTAAALQNPSVIANAVIESLPLMGAGGAVGRGVTALAPRAAGFGAGAIGEGVVGAGSAAEQIRQETSDGLLTGKQAVLAGATGLGVSALGAGGRKLAGKLGVGDVDEMIARGSLDVAARGAGQAAPGMVSRAGRGALSEGVFEEIPQSVVEQGLQNVALDRPIGEDLDAAVVLGGLSGGAMGAAGGAMSRPGGVSGAPVPAPGIVPPVPVPGAPPAPAAPVLPAGPAAPAAVSAAEVTRVAQTRLAELNALLADPAKPLAPAVVAERDFLATNIANPEALASNYGMELAPDGPKASTDMGLDANAGPISAAAVQAVDGGATQEVQAIQAAQEAAELAKKAPKEGAKPAASTASATSPALDAAPSPRGAFADAEMANEYIRAQRRAGGTSFSALPIRYDDGSFGVATSGTTDYEVARAQVSAATAPVTSTTSRTAEAIKKFRDRKAAVKAPKPTTEGTPNGPQADQAQQATPQREEARPAAPELSTPAAPVDVVAQDAATSPTNDRPEPTPAQKEAGNYKVGRARIAGLDISIENPQGSVRRGTGADGTTWETPMRDHYGYFRGTTAADGDKLDVFIKPGTASDFGGTVYVVDQVAPDTGKFDEAKVIFGATDQADAEAIYRRNYSEGWQGLGAITALPMPAFKTWATSKATRKPLGTLPSAANVQTEAQASTEQPAQAPPAQAPAAAGSDGSASEGVSAAGSPPVEAAGLNPGEFVRAPNGSLEYGEITTNMAAVMRRQAGKIRLQRGVQNKDGTGYGLAHIEANHGKQVRNAGFESVESFIAHVGGKFNEVLQASKGRQLLVAVTDGRRDVMFIQLEAADDGDYYRVNTAFPASRDYLEKQEGKGAKVLWVGSEPRPAVAGQQPLYAGKPDESSGQVAPIAQGKGGISVSGPAQDAQDDEPAAPAAEKPKRGILAKMERARQAKTAAASPPPATAPKPAEKIEDFGEKLQGARKDYATQLKDAQALDVSSVPLSQSWPEPDYQKMLDGGTDPFVVAFVHAARDEVPTKPQTAWKLKGWVESVNQLRSTSQALLEGTIARKALDAALTRSDMVSVRANVVSRAELYQEVGHARSLKGVAFAHRHYGLYNGQENVDKWVVSQRAKSTAFGNWPSDLVAADSKDEMLARFKAKVASLGVGSDAKAKTSFVIYRKRGAEGAFIGKKIGREHIDLHKAADVATARTYLAENAAALAKVLEQYKRTPLERNKENAPRVGDDHRNGAPVTPDVFGETFGFRGVQFGNYVEQGRRQSDLNEAFDALMDMAAVLDVPPRALSLNGRLGLAFGARGKGGKNAPAAHYEPNNVVINLTKGGGPGSLAHEWFHSMDNYFAKDGGGAGYMTDGARGDALRAEMREAFMVIKRALNLGGLKKRSQELDKRRSKPYWSTSLEMAARSFESYVIAKLQDQNAANDYLANVVDPKFWEAQEAMREVFEDAKSGDTYPYPTVDEMPALRAAFDDFFKTIQTRETEGGNVELFSLKGSQVDPAAPAPDTSEAHDPPSQAHRDAVAAFNASFAKRVEGGSDENLLDAVAPGSGNRGRSADTVSSVARRLFGREVVYVRFRGAPKFNGAVSRAVPGYIFINIDAQKERPFLAILGHELLHQMAKDQPGIYKNLSNRLDKIIKNDMTYGLQTVAAYRKAGVSLRGLDTREELEADIVGDNFTDPLFWEALSKDQPGLFKRVADFIIKWLDNVIARVGKVRPFGTDEFLTDLEEARAAVSDAMRQFSSASVGAVADQNSGNGAPPAAPARDQTASVAFKRWFGDSKVVDADGKPMVMYHGTNKTEQGEAFTMFDSYGSNYGLFGQGSYFTDDASVASEYTSKGKGSSPTVYAAYMSIKNPIDMDAPADAARWATAYPDLDLDAHHEGGTTNESYYRAAENALRDEGYEKLEGAEAMQDGLRRMGFDGITHIGGGRVKSEGKKHRVFIAFEPEQIKSATGNRGTFDPASADIRFSIADTARQQIHQFEVKGKPANTLKHYRGMAMQVLGRRQIVDLFNQELPQLESYNRLVQAMDAEKNDTGAEADRLATAWGNLDKTTKTAGEERSLAELMHDATLARIDPEKPHAKGDDRAQYTALRGRYDRLQPQSREAYKQARDMYADHYEQVQQAIKDRIERSDMSGSQKKAMIARMDEDFFKKTQGVYFPLARFGKYVMIVKDAEGEVVNVSRAETLNEAETTRKELLRTFDRASGHSVGKILKDAEFNPGRDAVGKGFMKELFDVLDKQGVDEALRDSVSQLYLSSLPDLSWAKHGIHRKGTPGFSQDARRAFAQNMFHGARYLAKLRYADQLQADLIAMQEHIVAYKDVDEYDSVKAQQVIDEMVMRHENLMNPKANPVSTALTSVGFVFYLGISPAAAMVNLSQTALVAYPIMGAKWGFAKSSAALLKASGEVVKAKNDISKSLAGDELDAYNQAVKDGTIDVTMAHDLAGISQGEDAKVAWAMRPVMRWASFLFHHAERFNRQATFLAAYRLSRGTGTNHKAAFEEAKRATYDGHFDYGASNRPRLMQGNVAKVVTLFKQYGQNMVYTLSRQAHLSMKGATPAERAEARKALGGILASHAMAAGTMGLPVVGPLLAAASFLGGDDDEPWDAEVALKNAMADALGPKAAEVIAHGLSRLTPWDVSGRVALDKLILPDVQEGLEGQRLAEASMAAALGPVGGILTGFLKGMQDISEGKYQRGLEAMLPIVLRNAVKAARFMEEGAVDRTGVVIKDEVSPAGVLGQLAGFAPSEVRLATEGRMAIYAHDRARMERRQVLMNQFAQARMAGNDEGVIEARDAIARFNEKNPSRRITPPQLARSVQGRQRRIDQAEQGVYLPRNRRDATEAGRFALQEP